MDVKLDASRQAAKKKELQNLGKVDHWPSESIEPVFGWWASTWVLIQRHQHHLIIIISISGTKDEANLKSSQIRKVEVFSLNAEVSYVGQVQIEWMREERGERRMRQQISIDCTAILVALTTKERKKDRKREHCIESYKAIENETERICIEPSPYLLHF